MVTTTDSVYGSLAIHWTLPRRAQHPAGRAVGSAVERSYQRGEWLAERRRLMDDWARFCASPAAEGENVVTRG